VSEDLRRAFALIAAGDMGGARTEESRFGVAVFDELGRYLKPMRLG
jgi:hypothetical protein